MARKPADSLTSPSQLFQTTTKGGKAKQRGPSGPSRWELLMAMYRGEIGSMCEGPALGATAPAFRLTTHDGKRKVSLSDYRGKKPVVLTFGSFT